MEVKSTAQGLVACINADKGDPVSKGDVIIVTELMKMLTEHRSPADGIVEDIMVDAGDSIAENQTLFTVSAGLNAPDISKKLDEASTVHPSIEELITRRELISDEGRQSRVKRRHQQGGRTARENVNDLLDDGSFNEIGGHALAAQHATHTTEQLIERSAADGVLVGTGTVSGLPVAVLIVDYTVMAGTQGHFHHKKVDRIIELAERRNLPMILYPEGGGGRPNDVDAHHTSIAQLELMTFARLSGLSENVPVLAVVHGYCFAGSAAFSAVADVIIATKSASIGMGGPAMIEGGGLGSFSPQEVGPVAMHAKNGTVDIVCDDEASATAVVKQILGHIHLEVEEQEPALPIDLDAFLPSDRRGAFDIREIIGSIFDQPGIVEIKPEFATNMITGFARLAGQSVGVMANRCLQMGGAIDGDAAQKAASFLELCDRYNLPLISLIDTPGFMVGPEAEATGQIGPIGRFFKAGARFNGPWLSVAIRRAYGLGAMAMAGGGLHACDLTISWPQGEFGAMGLEGAVRLGLRDELAQIENDADREARVIELVDELYERGRALNAATFFEIDDVILPSETRQRLITALATLS